MKVRQQFSLSTDLMERLWAWMDAQAVRPSASATVEAALNDWLERREREQEKSRRT